MVTGRLSFAFLAWYLLTAAFFVVDEAFCASLNIIAFGDSITTGYPYYPAWDVEDGAGNGSTGGGYEPVTGTDLANNGVEAIVFNWGQSGEFASDGVNRLESVLSGHQADYVLLMEGTNDLTFFLGCRSVVEDLSLMIDKIIAHGAIPLLSTLTPDTREGTWYKYIGNCNEQIRALAADKGVSLVDNYQAVVADWQSLTYDDLHPNTAGYSVLGKTWSSGIQKKIHELELEAMQGKTIPCLMMLLK